MTLIALLFASQQSASAQVFYEVDALIWWTKGNPLPVLLAESPAGTMRADAGVLGRGAVPLVGGRDADDMARYGGRSRLGYWLDDNEDDAIVFDWFTLGKADGHGDYYGSGAGGRILGRPFFNVVSGMEDSELVSFPGVVEGAVLIDSSSEMHSAGLHFRRNYMRGTRGRLDVLFGYRYMRFRETLHVQENLVNKDPMIIQIDTTIDVMDRFVTENDFNGLDVGFLLESQIGGLMVEMTGRLAVGAMKQEVSVVGQTIVTTPGDSPVANPGGLLALASNIGTRDHTELGIVPEIAIKLRYPLTDNLDFQFGYTLMMMNKVLRTGDQVDRVVNPSQLPMGGPPSGAPRPAPLFNDTLLWAQGLNLGIFGSF